MDIQKSEQMVDLILSHIIDNKLKPGDKLPSEEEMTMLFKASRVSIREGLRGLKFLGLLKSTTSRGTVIQEMDFSILTRCLGFKLQSAIFRIVSCWKPDWLLKPELWN